MTSRIAPSFPAWSFCRSRVSCIVRLSMRILARGVLPRLFELPTHENASRKFFLPVGPQLDAPGSHRLCFRGIALGFLNSCVRPREIRRIPQIAEPCVPVSFHSFQQSRPCICRAPPAFHL